MEKSEGRNEWQPLESNPRVINEYILSLGFDTSLFSFQEVFSVEDWAQAMIAKPVLGLLLAFPCNEAQYKHRKAEHEKIEKEGQTLDENLFYMYQYAGNACGSVGVFHILGNLPEAQRSFIIKDSVLHQFYEEAKGQDWAERGNAFNNNDKIKRSHVHAVHEGETQVSILILIYD